MQKPPLIQLEMQYLFLILSSAYIHGLLNSVFMFPYWKKASVRRIKREKSPNIIKQHTGRKQDRVYSDTDNTWLSLTTPGGESQRQRVSQTSNGPSCAGCACGFASKLNPCTCGKQSSLLLIITAHTMLLFTQPVQSRTDVPSCWSGIAEVSNDEPPSWRVR